MPRKKKKTEDALTSLGADATRAFRLDDLRQKCMAAARRLEMGAALELEHARLGLPPHRIGNPKRPFAERTAWQKNSESIATWLRGEAEILQRMGEGLE